MAAKDAKNAFGMMIDLARAEPVRPAAASVLKEMLGQTTIWTQRVLSG